MQRKKIMKLIHWRAIAMTDSVYLKSFETKADLILVDRLIFEQNSFNFVELLLGCLFMHPREMLFF